MNRIGRVEIPKSLFRAVLKVGDSGNGPPLGALTGTRPHE